MNRVPFTGKLWQRSYTDFVLKHSTLDNLSLAISSLNLALFLGVRFVMFAQRWSLRGGLPGSTDMTVLAIGIENDDADLRRREMCSLLFE